MISEYMQALINQLIQVEHQAAYLYLAMSAYFDRLNLKGMAQWLRVQHQEELGHAQRWITYLADRGGVVEIRGIPAQPVHFGSPAQAFQQVLAHEQYVTQAYRQAYEIAMRAGDYQTLVVIQEFLQEQTEEEAQSSSIAGRLQIASAAPAALLSLDEELGERTT